MLPLELAQRYLAPHALLLECGSGLDECGPFPLKLAFRLLADGSLQLKLFLRRGEHGSLVSQSCLQPLSLLEDCVTLLELGADCGDFRLPCRCEGARPSRSSRSLRGASSRSSSAVRTLSTAEAPSVAWAP
jgi:hypothetical protein